MAGTGRAPTPTIILENRGSWRAKARKKSGEPVLPLGEPEAPDFLPAEARAEWERQVIHLRTMGLLVEADRALLVVYCTAWATFAKTFTARPRGLRAQDRNFRQRQAAQDMLLKVAQQFGFSPSARTRVRSMIDDGNKNKTKARFFTAG